VPCTRLTKSHVEWSCAVLKKTNDGAKVIGGATIIIDSRVLYAGAMGLSVVASLSMEPSRPW
jgi:hypothetical protein